MTTVMDMSLPRGGAHQAKEGRSATFLGHADPNKIPGWDAEVMRHSNYSFFHSAAWAKTLESTYGQVPTYLTIAGTRNARSLLPLMEINSWLTGSRGVALPFTDFCDPLYQDADSARCLIQNALELGKSRHWKYVEFRGGRELFSGATASLSFYGHRLNLAKDEDLLFLRLGSSVRRAIHKAQNSGLSVTVSQGLDAMKTFYFLQCKTRRKHGLPPQPFAFFRNICQHVLSKGFGMIVVASHQNRPVAASVYFQLGTRAIYKFGASDESLQHLRGANLVMWEAIRELVRKGAKTLDLGRTSTGNGGLRRFKLGWGADEHKIEYFKYDLRRNSFVTDADSSMGWHNRIFRALPVGASRIIGAILYRHMA
jgi:CelD/BcsL family acetyltransferase involved in cellulose biosynthesis